ncbi:hypothetical protein O3M35_001804 [Rhynocoris fuscipes]|uniref:Uncharacterized protein n=1 Tax=Rhynocoris fuscipes TaxID=488301 RepID=A0AAW1CQ68_9HEMI
MAERLADLFSSPKFRGNRAHSAQKTFENCSHLLSTSRNDIAQDELSLEMDARSDGFTSRICDTANSLLLGEFPWGREKRHDFVVIKQKRIPAPLPVRVRIGPPNSSSLLQSDSDNVSYENEECNSSKTLIHALRALSRKRTHSFMNESEAENSERDDSAPATKISKPIEHRHNLYLSQLEEDTPEYKNGIKNQTDQHLERGKRFREDDTTNSSNGLAGMTGASPDVIQNKRQRLRSPDDHGTGISCNGNTINGILSQTNRPPRRGCNEIISSLSSSLSMFDSKLKQKFIKQKVRKERHKNHKKIAVVETQTQTTQPATDETPEIRILESPKKEDKSINTDPVRPAINEEKIVTDRMANALMKSAVKKFLATEDPKLTLIYPAPPASVPSPSAPSSNKETLLPPAVSSSSNLLQPSTGFTGNNSFSLPSKEKLPFEFGIPATTSTPSLPISTTNSTFTFGSPTTENKTTASSLAISSPFTSTTQANNSVTTSTSMENVKQISFGDKLEGGFKLPESKIDLKDDKSIKTSSTVAPNLFGQVTSTSSPASLAPNLFGQVTSTPSTPSTTTNVFGQVTNTSSTAPTTNTTTSNLFGQITTTTTTNSVTSNLFAPISSTAPTSNPFGQVTNTPSTSSTNATTSESSAKPTFSFPFSSSNSTVTTSSDPIKTSTFTFGNSNNNLIKPTATSPFGSTINDTSKSTNEPPKLSLFGATPTTQPSTSESTPKTTANTNTTSTGGFSFGGNNEIKKADSANTTQSKPEGLFSFGSTNNPVSTTKTENTFSFGGTTANTAETTQPAQQQSKPVFQFGSSSFGSAQPNKDGFSFGAKPAEPAPTSSFGSGGIFGAKPSTPATTSASTASTTTSGLFGFGAVQSAATTVTPTFGSVTSTTNSNLGGFQANKPDDKPSSGGFPFKFTGGTGGSNAEASKPSFTFGSSASQNPAPVFGSSTQPTFGNVAPAASNSTFPTFGATPSFGASSAAPNPAPAFGSSTVGGQSSAPVFGSSAAPNPVPAFGSSSATQPNPVPAFGSSTPAPSQAPAFGSSTPAPTQPPAFGSSTSAPTQAPAFGSSTPAAPTPAFGSSTPAPTFGSTAATQPGQSLFGSMQTQPTQGPSFTFGASSTSASSGGFNFGSPAQPSVQPGGTGLFQFGSSAAQQNPAGGVQPFQFGAASSNPPNPGFGFSSTLGGFNPGVGGQPMFSIGSGSTAPRSRQPLSRRKKV